MKNDFRFTRHKQSTRLLNELDSAKRKNKIRLNGFDEIDEPAKHPAWPVFRWGNFWSNVYFAKTVR